MPTLAQTLDYGTLEQLFHEPVTASATGKPQRASDAPVNMEIVTQDDIRRSGATSIPGVLQFVTGVDVRQYGIADAEVGIRGYNQPYNPRLLVLVNGRQVYSDDYGHVTWPNDPRAARRNPPDRGDQGTELGALWFQRRQRGDQHHHLRPAARQA